MASSHKFSFQLLDPVTGAFSTDDSFVSTKSTAYAVQQGGIRAKDPNGNEWTQTTLSRAVVKQTASIPQGQSVGFRSVGIHAQFKSAPTVSHVSVSPETQLTFTEGAENDISWVYGDLDNDPQTQWSVKIFDQFTYESANFSADNSAPLWQQSGSDASTSISLDSYLPQVTGTTAYNTGFVDGGVYYIAVKAAKDHNQAPFWSSWAYLRITVFIDQPKPPLMSVYTNTAQASNTLVIQSSDNLLGDNNGGMSHTIGDWRTTTKDTATTSVFYGHMATSNTNALPVGNYITSLNIGSTGYLATVGGITASATTGSQFTVSGKSGALTAATGFPISGTFWVTIGSEKILVTNAMDGTTTKPDTFTIVLRNYNPYTNTGGSGTAHNQWSPVIIGLQNDIITGSAGELVYTYDVTVYDKPIAHPGVVRWTTVGATATSSAGTPNNVHALTIQQAVDPQYKNERNYFWVIDGGDVLKANAPAYINYAKFNKSIAQTVWAKNPNGSGGQWKRQTTVSALDGPWQSSQTIKIGNTYGLGEAVTIKSVSTDQITNKSPVLVGNTTGTQVGGPFHPITAIDVHMATDGSGLGGSGTQNVNGTTKAGTKIRIFGPNGSFIDTEITKDVHWTGKRQGAWFWGWDKVTLPIKPLYFCKQFKTNTFGDNIGTYFQIVDGSRVQIHGSYAPNPVKKVTLTHDYGQGSFKGIILSKNDRLIVGQTAKLPSYGYTGGHSASAISPTTYTTPQWQESRTQTLNFTVDHLATKPPVPFRSIALPTSGTAFPLYNSLVVTVPQFNCSFANGASTISALINSDAASLGVGMAITGTGIQSGTTVTSVLVTPTGNSIGISLPTTASASANQITVAVASNAYQNYEVVMNGVPVGTTISSNTALSGTTFTITLSASGVVPIASYNPSTGAPTYNTVGSASFIPQNAHVIPAGSTSIPVCPVQVNFNYPFHCPVRIQYPALYGDNALFIKPLAAGSTNTSDISLVKQANVAWTSTNNVPVVAGQRYGLAGFSRNVVGTGTPAFTPYIDWYNEVGDLLASTTGRHSITTPYFTGNLNGTTTISGISSTTGLRVGNYLSGQGIPSSTYIVSISSNSIVISNAATITKSGVTISNSTSLISGAPITFTGTTSTASTTMTSVSSTTGLVVGQYVYGYGIPTATTIASIGSGQITLSAKPTIAQTGGTFRIASTGFPIGEVGNTFYYSPNSQWGQNWTPNAITGIAPSAHVIASAATFSGSGSTGTYSVPAGITTALSAGAVIVDGNGFTTTLTASAAVSATTVSVRFDSLPSGGSTGLFASATRAVPRFQWINAIANDVYALSSVMFRALTPSIPNSNYVALNTQIDTLQVPVASASSGYSFDSLVINSTTKTNGVESIFLLDPGMDYGTREVVKGKNNQILWTSLTSAVAAGATTISLNTNENLASGGTLVVGYNTTNAETVTIASGWDGNNPIPLSAPIFYNHPINDMVYGFTVGVSNGVIQPQATGTPVAVFNWNTDGWINTPKAHYGLTIQRSEDSGKTWVTLRNGGNVSVNSQGIATITDYEITPGAQQLYRSWATWTSPSAQQWQGEPTGSLTAPVMANTQWWISSTSNPALRYPLLVQNAFSETQKHTSGVMYPLGSRYPITIAGVVGGRDGSIDVIWNDLPNWQNFLDFLRLGEIYILLSPVENKKFYIFINSDVTWENNASSQPWRKVTIPYIETAPPNYGYTYGS